MKRLLAIAMFVLVAAVPGWAYMWQGTFTYEIEELSTTIEGTTVPGVPGLQVGDTFGGYYRYDSPIVDGTFGLPEGFQGYFNPRPLNEFGIFVPNPIAFNPSPGEPGQLYQWFNSTTPASSPLIMVSGGSVSFFYLHHELGPVGFDFDLTTFQLGSYGYGEFSQNYVSRGSIYFGDPTVVPLPSSSLLFGTGLIGVFGYIRWQLKRF